MTDKSLEQCVRSAFDWEPSLDANDIGVSVEEGIVTLRGYVGSYAQKMMAEQVVLRVYGVRAVANDIDVHPMSGFQRTDTALAQAAVAALHLEHEGAKRPRHSHDRGRMADAERDG